MTRRSAVTVGWLILFAVAGSSRAFAQDSHPLQLGVGYQFLHESVNGGGQTFPLGVYAEVEHAVIADQMKSIGWMGQFELAYRTDSGFSEQLYTALGGIRLASTKRLRWVPSGFGLVGIGTLNASCNQFCIGTDSGAAVQGGFAMSTHLSDAMLLDVTFKATKLWVQGGGVFNAAIAGGLRLNLGR
jgi:hypothetical protein